MPSDDLKFVGHMLDVAQQIDRFVQRRDRQIFDSDEVFQLALTHLVQTFGEAATRVSPDFRTANPSLPRPQITGMRHRIVHDYFNVDLEIVWEVVTVHIPTLIPQLGALITNAQGNA